MSEKIRAELNALQNVWQGGYYMGDPLQPLAPSPLRQFGYLSSLHVTYLMCIKPYAKSGTTALEIGPGRGAWTKALLPCKEVWTLDALSAEHNNFYDFVGRHSHVKYFQVQDCECRELPDNHFDYVFSYGCLCHVSFENISMYAHRLFAKLKPGANCFWMVADYEKFNRALSSPRCSIWESLKPIRRAAFPITMILNMCDWWQRRSLSALDLNEDNDPRPGGRWYNAGTERTCTMLQSAGYEIVDPDLGVCVRDPMIHFRKP